MKKYAVVCSCPSVSLLTSPLTRAGRRAAGLLEEPAPVSWGAAILPLDWSLGAEQLLGVEAFLALLGVGAFLAFISLTTSLSLAAPLPLLLGCLRTPLARPVLKAWDR